MKAKKFLIGSQFIVYATSHPRGRGYTAQDVIVIDTKTNEITGKFCDALRAQGEAEQGLDNVLNYYWIEAQETEPGCAVKEVK